MGSVVRWGDLALALLVIAALATFAGRLFWVLDLMSHFQVYYFCGAVLLLVGNLVFWRRVQIGVALVLVGVGLFHLLPYDRPVPVSAGGGKTHKVMLLNLNLGNQKTAAVKAAVAQAKPDLLVLQEVTPRWKRELASLEASYEHSFDLPEEGAFGLWVLSCFKLNHLDVQRREEIAFLHLTYEVGGRSLELVAMHPFPPVGAAASRIRNTILESAAVYAAGDGSRMTVGDLNCSPWSPHFRRFLNSSGLRDSALGRGVKGTWYPGQPLFGIPVDHVLVSPDIEVVDRVVGGDVGSDHRAVVVTFRFSAS